MGDILIVDDELECRRLFRRILTHFGYTTLEAPDGQVAVELALQARPDLVLMDLTLPVLSGWEATRRIRQHPDLLYIPVIAVTAHALADDRDRALRAGCNDYLSKPIDVLELVAMVKTWVGRSLSNELVHVIPGLQILW